MASPSELTSCVNEAKVAQEAMQYDKMMESMKKVAKLNVELTTEERDLFCLAYKNVIALRRSSAVVTSDIPRDEKMEFELTMISNDAIAIIDDHLIPSSSVTESIVLYHTMKGDFYRYLAELKTGEERKKTANLSLKAYLTASDLADAKKNKLPVSNYVRLGVALNMSKLLFEVMGHKNNAISYAETAYYEASLEIQKESCENSKIIWNLLMENVAEWNKSLHPNVSKKLAA